MKSLINKFFVVMLVVSFGLNVSGCATYKVHPEFKERHKNIRSVAMMPPEVDAYILTFQGDRKILNDLIPVMAKTTLDRLNELMSNKGYEIKKLDLSEEALVNNPELRTTLFHVNEIFKKQLEDISKNKQKKFTYTVGADANTFANLADCDILIFVKEDGIKKSAGEIAKDVAKGLMITAACLLIGAIYIPIPQTAATVVHVAVVDGNDGAILWYNNNAATPSWDPSNQAQLSTLIKSLAGPFPDSAFKPKDTGKLLKTQKPAPVAVEQGKETTNIAVKTAIP